MKPRALLAALAFTSALQACGSTSTPAVDQSFALALRATSDDGQPLRGVTFATRSTTLGQTGAAGEVSLKIRGKEGQLVEISAACPNDLAAPEEASRLRLTRSRRLGATTAEPTVLAVVCTRRSRDVVLVVHAENGPALPIVVDGNPTATTDADGNAHILVHLDRGIRSLNVSLDTAGSPQLRPQNPSRAYELTGHDTALLFQQELAIPRPPARKAATAERRRVPYRVD